MNNADSSNEILLTNLQAVLPDRTLPQADLRIVGDKIAGFGLATPDQTPVTVDFAGDIIIPGLIDLHVHGCGGADTMDASATALGNMATALLQHGTTAFLATTMTASTSRLQAVLSLGKIFHPTDWQAEFLGFHMEGPCISPDFHGAQNISELSEVPIPVNEWVKILTLAPELSAARAYMEMAKNAGIILSAGHSGASYEQMQIAIKEGVYYMTHAFNAMPGIHHRAPGMLSAALLNRRVTIELIADGIHVHPAVLEMALRLKGAERVVLVSDGTRAVGMPDGEYELGGQQVRLHQGKMTLPDGTIAGSAKPLLAGVRFITEVVGRPLHEAVRMATLNPARLLGIDACSGSLKPGAFATFLRLSPELELKEVWIRGHCRFSV
jgi:N-acetylglucosamine-6-phosphate deacetylase